MNHSQKVKQSGLSLVELMVGMVIGLLATLVIVNVFSGFEQQKRTTTGNSDAQTNGAIALFNVQRDLQSAGYGLPVYGTDFTPYNCPTTGAAGTIATIDHDNNAGTPQIGISPVVITDGGAGSDIVSIHYGSSSRGGIPVIMNAGTGTAGVGGATFAVVDSHMGCNINDPVNLLDNDMVLIVNQQDPVNTQCSMARVVSLSPAAAPQRLIQLSSATNVQSGNFIACLGVWNEIQYRVENNQLTRSGAVVNGVPSAQRVPVVPDIVNMQAQYGIAATANTSQVTQWVDATGIWANPTAANRNRIKAVRIALVARNGLLETDNVTAPCSSLTAANPTGLCAWDGSVAGSAAPAINLAADANWQRYRYRVYESVLPIRNIIWSRDKL